jgi:hypothetical protein
MNSGASPQSVGEVGGLLALAFLLIDLLASGPYRGLARNKRMSRETYSQLQPFFIPAQYASQLPAAICPAMPHQL